VCSSDLALSHPIRREIIAQLRGGAMTAGDLAALFDVSKPTMSTHFAALKEADLITADKVGVTINYHLNITVAEEAMSALMGVLGAGDAEAAPATPKRPATQKRKGAPS